MPTHLCAQTFLSVLPPCLHLKGDVNPQGYMEGAVPEQLSTGAAIARDLTVAQFAPSLLIPESY